MKVTIIGAGNTAAAAACHMLSRGLDVRLYVRNAEKAAYWSSHTVRAAGKLSGDFKLSAVSDPRTAISGADILVVATQAQDHRQAAADILPFLEKGQAVLILNGCWGALQACAVFGKARETLGLTVAETANMPYIASLSNDWSAVNVKGIKEAASFSAIGPEKGRVRALLSALASEVKEEISFAVTSLGSTNPIIHVTTSLFNATRIDNGEDFLFFGAPMTKRTVAVMEAADAERVAVGKALGVRLPTLLEGLNSFWPVKWPTLYEALTKNASYAVSKGPVSLAYRYLSEDLPCGMQATLDLAHVLGVETPVTETIVRAASMYLGKFPKPFLTAEDAAFLKTLETGK